MYTSKIKNIKEKSDVPGSMIAGQILMNSTGGQLPLAGDSSAIIEGEWTDELDWLFEGNERERKIPSGTIPKVLDLGHVGIYKVTDQRIKDMVQYVGSDLAQISVLGSKLPDIKEPMISFVNRMAEELQIPSELMPIVNDAASCFNNDAYVAWIDNNWDSEILSYLGNNGFYVLGLSYLMMPCGLDAFEVGKKYTNQEDMDLFLQVYSVSIKDCLNAYMFYDDITYDIYIMVYCNSDINTPISPDL